MLLFSAPFCFCAATPASGCNVHEAEAAIVTTRCGVRGVGGVAAGNNFGRWGGGRALCFCRLGCADWVAEKLSGAAWGWGKGARGAIDG